MATDTNTAAVPLLDVKGLKTYFYTEDGVVQAVSGVSGSSASPGAARA